MPSETSRKSDAIKFCQNEPNCSNSETRQSCDREADHDGKAEEGNNDRAGLIKTGQGDNADRPKERKVQYAVKVATCRIFVIDVWWETNRRTKPRRSLYSDRFESGRSEGRIQMVRKGNKSASSTDVASLLDLLNEFEGDLVEAHPAREDALVVPQSIEPASAEQANSPMTGDTEIEAEALQASDNRFAAHVVYGLSKFKRN